jgi:hypothetical protein
LVQLDIHMVQIISVVSIKFTHPKNEIVHKNFKYNFLIKLFSAYLVIFKVLLKILNYKFLMEHESDTVLIKIREQPV